MYPEQLRSNFIALCGALLIASVICVEQTEIHREISHKEKHEDVSSNGNEVMHWPWPSRKFKCPTAFGAYPDPDDCAFFYICVARIGTRTRCPYMYRFCTVRRVCLPMLIAVCDDGTGEVTEQEVSTTVADEVTEQEVSTTQEETSFLCPEEKGNFPYPYNCAKYYYCLFDKSYLVTCPDSQLFDGVKRECRKADKVHCGSRLRPTAETPSLETTQEIITSSSDVATDDETETDDQDITVTQEEIVTTTDEVNTSPEETATSPDDTTSPTVSEIPTTKPRVTAPDTDCDEDDLDCIIDDLGITPDWFVCPDDLGSYPHPTSQKLFIFCFNWKPLVKKCGQDLVFSEEHMTCVTPY